MDEVINMTLHQRFFEAARLDLAASRVLTEIGLYQPAIYHLQQGYEKCIKSYYIFKEVTINNTLETTVYRNLRNQLGHDIDESTINLLKDLADIEKHGYEIRLPNTTDQRERQVLQNTITAIDGYKTAFDRLAQRLNLETIYINNGRNYSQYVRTRYEEYHKLVDTIVKQPSTVFYNILLCMLSLYPCLYKMVSVTRYPLIEFGYDNLTLLGNEPESCRMIIEMLQDLITLASNELT
jgi:HEPN domain-containing protein